jgi:hypothetical protein
MSSLESWRKNVNEESLENLLRNNYQKRLEEEVKLKIQAFDNLLKDTKGLYSVIKYSVVSQVLGKAESPNEIINPNIVDSSEIENRYLTHLDNLGKAIKGLYNKYSRILGEETTLEVLNSVLLNKYVVNDILNTVDALYSLNLKEKDYKLVESEKENIVRGLNLLNKEKLFTEIGLGYAKYLGKSREEIGGDKMYLHNLNVVYRNVINLVGNKLYSELPERKEQS